MKAKDIINYDDIPEDDCAVCTLYEKAYEKLKGTLTCPHCGEKIHTTKIDFEYNVVGEQNAYNEDDDINYMPVIDCPHCNDPIGLKPIPITYNGNHDIYYTGGKYYVVGEKPKLNDAIKKSIEQFTDRIKNGENLNAWNLQTWIEYDIEHLIAEYLYKNGLKD